MAAIKNSGVWLLVQVSRPANWGILVTATVGLSGILELAGLPATLRLGGMIAAILVETNGRALRVPRLSYYAAQTGIGCRIARVISAGIVETFLKAWPLRVGVMLVACPPVRNFLLRVC